MFASNQPSFAQQRNDTAPTCAAASMLSAHLHLLGPKLLVRLWERGYLSQVIKTYTPESYNFWLLGFIWKFRSRATALQRSFALIRLQSGAEGGAVRSCSLHAVRLLVQSLRFAALNHGCMNSDNVSSTVLCRTPMDIVLALQAWVWELSDSHCVLSMHRQ